jgi:hypothetical protein
LLKDWDNPILQDTVVLANFILKFKSYVTPLMKILTGLELLLAKLEEWETYASKKLNSMDKEVILIK